MTAVRWVVEHPQDQLGTGGWIEYPDERTARAHAGTNATVWALVTPEAVDVLTAAREWWATETLHALSPSLLDDQETALGRAVAALDRARSQRHGQTQTAHGASETNS